MARARATTTRLPSEPQAPPSTAEDATGSPEPEVGKPAETKDFTLDDSVLAPPGELGSVERPEHAVAGHDAPRSGRAPAGRRRRRLRLPGAGRGVPARGGTADHAPVESLSTQGLTLSVGLFGAALLLVGLLFFGLQRENLGLDPFAQWRAKPPAAAPAAAPDAAPGAARDGVQTVQVPAPRPTARPAARPAAPPPAVRPAAPPATRPGAPPATRPAVAARVVIPEVPRALTRRPPRVLPENPAPADRAAARETVADAAPQPPAVPQEDPAAGATDEETQFTLAAEYRQVGDSGSAEQVYRQLFRESRQKARAAFALGELLMERERYPEAREMYTLSKELQDAADRSRVSRK